MNRVLASLLAIFVLLLGCKEAPPESDLLVSADQRPRIKPLPDPKSGPPDTDLIDRILNALPATETTARQQLRSVIRDCLQRKRYRELESLETHYHSWPDRDSFHTPLEFFYKDASQYNKPELLDAWLKASPESHAAVLCRVHKDLLEAYELMLLTPPEELPEDKLAQLMAIVEKAESRLQPESMGECPMYHATLIELALLRGAPREEIRTLLEASDKVYPGFLPAYARAAVHRMPGWAGSLANDPWYGLAEDIPVPGELDPKLWEQARLAALANAAPGAHAYFTRPPKDQIWDQLQPSFEAALKLHPRSAKVLNVYAQRAQAEFDEKTVEKLLGLLGDRWDLDRWPDYYTYARLAGETHNAAPSTALDYPNYIPDGFPLSENFTRVAIRREISNLYLRGRFPELEALGQKIFEERKTLPSGYEFRSIYLDALKFHPAAKSANWQQIQSLARSWEKAYPNSLMAKVCQAGLVVQDAWHARGPGYAQEVSEENFKLFHQHLGEALPLYQEILKSADDPVILESAAYAHLSAGDQERGFLLLEKALEKEPVNWTVINTATHFHLTRWYGKPGDLGRVAKRTHQNSGKFKTAGTAYVVDYALDYGESQLYETEVSWKDAKQGFEDLIKVRNTPLLKNKYARAAAQAGDSKTVQRLSKELDDLWEPNVKEHL